MNCDRNKNDLVARIFFNFVFVFLYSLFYNSFVFFKPQAQDKIEIYKNIR
jgi:hypothetical protein